MKARSTAKPEQSRHHGSSDRGSGQAKQAMAVVDSRPEMVQQQGLLSLMAGSPRLQRKFACGAPSAAGGSCANCEAMEKVASSGVLQKKLAIGAADDPLEREADRVADQVIAMPLQASVVSSPPSIQRFAGQVSGQMDTAPESVERLLASSGSPLEPALRRDMEHRFGYDFSGVQVHSDAAADQSAREVNAHAYTVGNNIVFGVGRFKPDTHQGRRLIAHELAHVVQQGFEQPGRGGGGVRRQAGAKPEPSETVEADKAQRAEKSKVPWMTADLKQKWIAVVLAEAAPDDATQEQAFAWVYYNRMSDVYKGKGAKAGRPKGESGLEGSSAYLGKQARYGIWLYKQGDTSLGKAQVPILLRVQNPNEFVGTDGIDLTTVEAVCTDPKGAYQRAQNEARLTRVRKLIEHIVKDPDLNPPIVGFQGQGNLKDFNNLSNDDPTWRKARYYFYLQYTEKGLNEWVKFYPTSPTRHSQFVFRLDKIESFIRSRGIKKIDSEKVPFVDVVNGQAVFVESRENITALLQKKKPKEEPATPPARPVQPQSSGMPAEQPEGRLQRQAAETAPAPVPAPPPAASWEEAKTSKESIVTGKSLAQVEEIIGGGKYEQLANFKKGVAAMVLPVFKELLTDKFKGFDYEPEVGVDENKFRENANKVKTYMLGQLQIQITMVIEDLAAQEAIEALAKEGEKPVKPQEDRMRKEELKNAAVNRIKERITEDPKYQETIAAQARDKTAEQLAEGSAGTLCYFMSRYIYYRAINRIGADVSFASWYKTQLRQGRVGEITTGVGLARGKSGGSPEETKGMQVYSKLEKIPAGVRLAISKQLYREWTDKKGEKHESEHFFLVFKDDNGRWRNLDHVTMSKPWHGELTDPTRVKALFCVPTKEATAQAPATSPPKPAQPPALASPPVEVTPEEQRLQQCFQQIVTPSGEMPDESRNMAQ